MSSVGPRVWIFRYTGQGEDEDLQLFAGEEVLESHMTYLIRHPERMLVGLVNKTMPKEKVEKWEECLQAGKFWEAWFDFARFVEVLYKAKLELIPRNLVVGKRE
jgi:hypothetical protein